MNSAPELFIQWEPRWATFKSNLRPALTRATTRLAIECSRPRYGSFCASLVGHIAIVAFSFTLWTSGLINTDVGHIRPPDFSHVIYYRTPELPELLDRGGAEQGRQGKSGGHELYHPTQTIHIARGPEPVDRVVDAPKLKLPRTNEPVANLLALGGPIVPTALVHDVRRSLSQNLLDAAVTPAEPAPNDPTRALSSAPKLELPMSPVHPAAQNTSRSLSQAQLAATQMEVVQPATDNTSRSIKDARLAAVPLGIVQPATDNTHRSIAQARLAAMPLGIVQPAAENTTRSLADARLVAPVGVIQPEAGNSGGELVHMASLASPAAAPTPPSGGGGGLGGQGSGGSSNVASKSASVGGTQNPRPSSGSAQPGAGGDGGPTGIIMSAHPGTAVGMPEESILGSLAMSPKGGSGEGIGGSGSGAGIGKGSGPGGGRSGAGSGAGKAGSGRGADPSATGGTSLSPGPGGAGNGNGNGTQMAGIAISGGILGRSGPASVTSKVPRGSYALTIISGGGSGGATRDVGVFDRSETVYAVYISMADAGGGPDWPMQYALLTPGSASQGLLAPPMAVKKLQATGPADPTAASTEPVFVTAIIDAQGKLQDLRTVRALGTRSQAAVAALAQWEFLPAEVEGKPVASRVLIGVMVVTPDKFAKQN